MKKILWLSRHKLCAAQFTELRFMFGTDVWIDRDAGAIENADDALRRFQASGYDDLVVVAPLSVIAALCARGVHPLWSEAAEENNPRLIDFRGARGQGFRFVRFRRVKRVALEFED